MKNRGSCFCSHADKAHEREHVAHDGRVLSVRGSSSRPMLMDGTGPRPPCLRARVQSLQCKHPFLISDSIRPGNRNLKASETGPGSQPPPRPCQPNWVPSAPGPLRNCGTASSCKEGATVTSMRRPRFVDCMSQASLSHSPEGVVLRLHMLHCHNTQR